MPLGEWHDVARGVTLPASFVALARPEGGRWVRMTWQWVCKKRQPVRKRNARCPSTGVDIRRQRSRPRSSSLAVRGVVITYEGEKGRGSMGARGAELSTAVVNEATHSSNGTSQSCDPRWRRRESPTAIEGGQRVADEVRVAGRRSMAATSQRREESAKRIPTMVEASGVAHRHRRRPARSGRSPCSWPAFDGGDERAREAARRAATRGGGVGSRTRVRKRSTLASTCVALLLELRGGVRR